MQTYTPALLCSYLSAAVLKTVIMQKEQNIRKRLQSMPVLLKISEAHLKVQCVICWYGGHQSRVFHFLRRDLAFFGHHTGIQKRSLT